jgi:hypothetical protein
MRERHFYDFLAEIVDKLGRATAPIVVRHADCRAVALRI